MTHPASPKSRPNAAPPPATETTILRVGADGDGVAALPDGTPLYLPDTLPGERVQATPVARRGDGWAADAVLLAPSPDRVAPPCPHFGIHGDACGGCTLQHWRDEPYAAWKQDMVAASLCRAGAVDVPVAPLLRTPPAARRRMDLALRRDGATVRIGLHQRRSATVVDMRACPILHPTLFALVQALRPALAGLSALRREGSALVNLLATGPDLLLRTDGPLTASDRAKLAALAEAQGVPRIAWALRDGPAETACQLRPVQAEFAGAVTQPPPGAFLQASAQGEAAIVAAVGRALTGLPPRARIVELFAGSGTLTGTLAAHGRVEAFEGDDGAFAALRRAAIPGVTARQRDLVRQPLQGTELRGVQAVVLDPPWAGAAPQMPALAEGKLALVVYVSCNPAALSRDAAILLRAGYRVAAAQPIDQFLWSGHTEAVVAFTRGRR